MKGKKKLSAILATLLLAISVFAVIPFPAHAAPGAKLIIPHKTDLSPKVQIGGTTSIGIKVNTTDMVFNWTISFSYNTSFLMYYTAIEGLFLKKDGATTFTQGTPSGNQVIGLSSTHGVGNVTIGTGKPDDMAQMAVTLVFVVLGYGKSDIEFIQGQCSMYSDNLGSAIALTFDDGYLEVEGKVTVEIEDVYLTTATHSVGDTFTADLTIDTQENISSWEGGFRYDPTILNCTAVMYGTFFGAATNNSGTIHPTNGTAWGFGQSLSGSSVKGTGKLASLVFKILDYGRTTIDLSLVDGDTIEFKVKDRWVTECTNLDLVDGSLESRAGVAVALPYINAWPSSGSTLTVDLKIASAEKVTSWQGGFVFDNTVLNCTGASYGGFMSGAQDLPIVVNNTAGMVIMGQFLLGGA
ncbi:MAG: cohesin domain-containing protein, partial [Candidatus Bathyarchaeota archaeon]|nr:cohesin domain-containing protein [Candidatus Bathyarchaeota archaeon]